MPREHTSSPQESFHNGFFAHPRTPLHTPTSTATPYARRRKILSARLGEPVEPGSPPASCAASLDGSAAGSFADFFEDLAASERAAEAEELARLRAHARDPARHKKALPPVPRPVPKQSSTDGPRTGGLGELDDDDLFNLPKRLSAAAATRAASTHRRGSVGSDGSDGSLSPLKTTEGLGEGHGGFNDDDYDGNDAAAGDVWGGATAPLSPTPFARALHKVRPLFDMASPFRGTSAATVLDQVRGDGGGIAPARFKVTTNVDFGMGVFTSAEDLALAPKPIIAKPPKGKPRGVPSVAFLVTNDASMLEH